MATYTELFGLRSNDDLRNRVSIACIVAAEAIRSESDATTNHANRLKWAKRVFEHPEIESARMLWALLAANKSATVAQITGVSDTNMQTGVDNAVNLFADGS